MRWIIEELIHPLRLDQVEVATIHEVAIGMEEKESEDSAEEVVAVEREVAEVLGIDCSLAWRYSAGPWRD